MFDPAVHSQLLGTLWGLAVLLPNLVQIVGVIVLIVLLCRPSRQRVSQPVGMAYPAR